MGYRLRTARNAQNSGRKSAAVRMAYLIRRRLAAASACAQEFVSLEIIDNALHARCGVVSWDFVSGSDVGDDLAHRLALFEALPDHHRGLVQLIIFFGVEIRSEERRVGKECR